MTDEWLVEQSRLMYQRRLEFEVGILQLVDRSGNVGSYIMYT